MYINVYSFILVYSLSAHAHLMTTCTLSKMNILGQGSMQCHMHTAQLREFVPDYPSPPHLISSSSSPSSRPYSEGMEFEHCLKLVRSASSDTERMAALMLVSFNSWWQLIVCKLLWVQVAKLIKSNEIGAEGRKRVFDAVGFTFINRLLATSEHA